MTQADITKQAIKAQIGVLEATIDNASMADPFDGFGGMPTNAANAETARVELATLVAELAALEFGTVEFGGKTYSLTTQAEASNYGTDGLVRYYSRAVDSNGGEYLVAWDTTDAWDVAGAVCLAEANGDEERAASLLKDAGITHDELPDIGDESNACDWDSPASVKAI